MIILDTNVLSEFVQPEPSPIVLAWLDAEDRVRVGTTAVNVAEQMAGLARMPAGRRRDHLAVKVARVLRSSIGDRILPFDFDAAQHYAEVLAARFGAGQPISMPDAQIAAICRQHAATLATRNVKDFAGTGVELINPWQDAGRSDAEGGGDLGA
jgi:predicted nucleic acid-binding protein